MSLTTPSWRGVCANTSLPSPHPSLSTPGPNLSLGARAWKLWRSQGLVACARRAARRMMGTLQFKRGSTMQRVSRFLQRSIKRHLHPFTFTKGKDTITFFYHTATDFSTFEPIAEEARSRGHATLLTSDLSAPAKVGIYCQHSPDPSNSEFSVAMLHDAGQEYCPDRQNLGTNFWRVAPWNDFDIGILPGQTWSRAWRRLANKAYARPRLGVFEVGWPKADRIFSSSGQFQAAAQRLRTQIGLSGRPCVILAPSWETADKQRLKGFINRLESLPVDLLVKYWPEIDIDPSWQLNKLTGKYRNVVILDPRLNILDGLALTDRKS